MINQSRTKNLMFCALFTALIVVGGFLRIPIPLVPFTMQFLFTNMAGLLLGKKLGSLSVFTYIFIGLIGVPVFTNGGGIFYVLHPTFGYLIGFLVGAFVAGLIVEKAKNRDYKSLITASLINLAIVYIIGVIYFFLISTFYLSKTFTFLPLIVSCCLVFLPGDLASCALIIVLFKRICKIVPSMPINQITIKHNK